MICSPILHASGVRERFLGEFWVIGCIDKFSQWITGSCWFLSPASHADVFIMWGVFWKMKKKIQFVFFSWSAPVLVFILSLTATRLITQHLSDVKYLLIVQLMYCWKKLALKVSGNLLRKTAFEMSWICHCDCLETQYWWGPASTESNVFTCCGLSKSCSRLNCLLDTGRGLFSFQDF